MKKDEGLRFNSGKTRYDLVPAYAQEQYARVLTKGSEKYADRNWERGMAWSKVLASLERHLQAIKRGEDYDKESGLLHSAHVMCNAAFLTEYYKIYPEGDDRPHYYLNPKKIGLDIDEVLAAWLPSWCKYWNLNNPTSWFFDRNILKKFDAMKEANTLDDFYLSLEPQTKPDDIPFEPYCYVTSRPVSTETTEKWLDKNGYPHRPVYTVEMGQSKVDTIKSLNLDIFVDDRFDNFVELNKAGICCYLFDAPHNQRYDVGYKRIKSLKDLL
jgi:5'(3')-deoxyribonucleotidase